MADAFDEARALLVKGVVSVFEERGSVIVPRGSGTPFTGSMLGRAILFEGGEVRGVVAVTAELSIWETFVPEDLRPLPPDLLPDMVGEVCNLILGRLQGALLRRGIYIASGTPVPDTSCYLPPGHGGRTDNASEVFEAPSGLVFVRFDFRVREGFALGPEEEAEPLPATTEDLLWL